ncbi:melanoregulin-like isoform X2 [Pelodiscus sinensis]|uniref:melanoregulin-like isoform X2 n=1 Tax=Pelodiscus sinensis TaxID=13735 RepID=UPI003F6B893C
MTRAYDLPFSETEGHGVPPSPFPRAVALPRCAGGLACSPWTLRRRQDGCLAPALLLRLRPRRAREQPAAQLGKRKRAQATNLWNEPADDTHMERDDDRELYNLLQKRAKLRRGSEGYRRLSFDISAHRQIRREVKDRWRQILEALGFSTEADGLLDVTSMASYSSLCQPLRARQLLAALAEQTSLFDRHCSLPERYLFVLAEEGAPSEDEPPSAEAVLVTLSPGAHLEEEEEEEEAVVLDEESLLVKLME